MDWIASMFSTSWGSWNTSDSNAHKKDSAVAAKPTPGDRWVRVDLEDTAEGPDDAQNHDAPLPLPISIPSNNSALVLPGVIPRGEMARPGSSYVGGGAGNAAEVLDGFEGELGPARKTSQHKLQQHHSQLRMKGDDRARRPLSPAVIKQP